jgi:hypothetical protein
MLCRCLLLVCLLPFCAHATAADDQPPPAKDGWIELSDLGAFQQPTGAWAVVGDARLDPKNDRQLVGVPGHGTLFDRGAPGKHIDLLTRQQWADVEVSLEFLIPCRSNSGVKLHGLYEIQIRDTAKAVHLTGADCGGVYPRAELRPRYHVIDAGVPPRVNAAGKPGEWQTLDIVFHGPRFDAKGQKTANARFDRVVLNGKLIHENVEVPCPTGAIWRELNREHAEGPLLLQGDHGPAIFRHIRLRPLPKPAEKTPSS